MKFIDNIRKRITSTMNWDSPFFTILALMAFAVFIFGLVLLVGWVLSFSWNYVMPEVFGLPKINIAKAWALLIVTSMLIKSDIKTFK